MSSFSIAQVTGPAMVGGLISLLSAPFVMLLDALTFLWSGWLIGRIRMQEPAPDTSPADRHLRREIGEGLGALMSSPILRSMTLSMGTIIFSGYLFTSVYVLYMTDALGLSATGVGLVFACGGVGSLLGSVVAAPIAKRAGVGRTIVVSAVAFGVLGLAVPLAIFVPDYALELVLVAEYGQWMALLVFEINAISLRQALTPDRLQGRVAASGMAIAGGMQPLSALTGGLIGSWLGVQTALIVGCAGMFLAAFWVWRSPTVDQQTLPSAPDPDLAQMRISDAAA